MPAGPAVAGVEALRDRHDPMDRADRAVERHCAIGAYKRVVTFLGIHEAGARCYQSTFDQGGEGYARRLTCRDEGRNGWRFERLGLGNALLGRLCVFRVLLATDKAAAKPPGDRSRRARSGELMKHQG